MRKFFMVVDLLKSIFSPDMHSSVHISNERKDIFIVVKGPTDSLDDTKLTAEKEYFINFTKE